MGLNRACRRWRCGRGWFGRGDVEDPGPEIARMAPVPGKHDAGRQSNCWAAQFTIPDAPAPDERVVALGVSTGGRPQHRTGDRSADLAAMGHDPDNPAGV